MGSIWLHTDTAYNSNSVEAFNISNTDSLREKSVSYLEGAEQKLYDWVGASDYEQFINILRKLFGEASDVREALMNFKKVNLISNLGLPQSLKYVGETVAFTLTSEVSPNITNIIKQKLQTNNSDFTITVDGDDIRLSFEYNENNIKTFLNAYYNKERFTIGSSNSRSDKTNPLRYANKAFRNLINSNQLGKVTVNGKSVDKHFTVDVNNSMKDNFKYKKEDIQKAMTKNTPEAALLRSSILQAQQTIHDTLLSFMNGIPDLEKAFERAWHSKMGTIGISNTSKILDRFSFFAKGDNLSAGVSGAVQELYTAIIAEYINIKIGNGIYGRVANILGNVVKGGEQPKTDVQILYRIGIQVKAYSMDRAFTQMSTNIHPGALEQSLAPFGVSNLADTIVQAVFNSSNGDYQSLADELEPALAQLMSMTTSNQVRDTVCFYMVDSQFLVPGSEILAQLRSTEFDIKIRTSHEPQSNAYFNAWSIAEHEENFLQYFNGARASLHASFTAENVTDDNYDLYNKLMNKEISIDVKFDYSFMGASRYSIF